MRLIVDDILFKLRHLGKKYRPKSPKEVLCTIETFGFGIENYVYKNGTFRRISK